MPDIYVRIQVGDAVEMVRLVETQLEDPSVLMKDVLLLMIRSTQLTLQAEGRPTRWTPLAQSTINARLRKNASGRAALKAGQKAASGKVFGKKAVSLQDQFFAAVGAVKMLRDTGALAMSVGMGAAGAFEAEDGFGESDKFTAELGTNRVQAYALQFVIAGGRVFLLIQDQDEEDVMDMALDFVMGTGAYA